MKNLIKFFIRFHLIFLFLILEVLSILMIVKYNNYHRVSFLNSSNVVSGSIFSAYTSVEEYLALKSTNLQLAEENAKLKSSFYHLGTDSLDSIGSSVPDTIVWLYAVFDSSYVYTSAKVINNSTNKTYNYFTLNKGSEDNIEPDMGVINPNGVVGIVTRTSAHYSTVMSILNPRLNISAKIKKNGYYGPLTWEGIDYTMASLKEIPFHVTLSVGDTIVTSGFTSIFPEGIMLGTISDFRINGGSNFYEIDVKLSAGFKNVTYVEVIKNKTRDERLKLEAEQND